MEYPDVVCNVVIDAHFVFFFFFKQKTAYEIGLGIPAEPLFRSNMIKLLSRKPTALRLVNPSAAKIKIFTRSEERFSRNAETDLVCRLLLEKKNSLAAISALGHSDWTRRRASSIGPLRKAGFMVG